MTEVIKSSQLKKLKVEHSATMTELQRYKLLVDSVQDYAIFLLDENGHIMTWNKGAQQHKGYSKEEIVGKHFSIFYMPSDVRSRKPERELELAKKFGRVEDEDWRVRKDGGRFWANVVITALFDEDDKLIGFAKVTRDLTERKQYEDHLRQANTLLKQQQREQEKLNKSKDEFVSLASHQLRTPATGTKQSLGLLLEGFSGKLAPEHTAIIRQAYDSNERQLAVVNKLLKIAQLDAQKVALRKEPVHLGKLIESIVGSHTDSFKRRHQTVTVDGSDATDIKTLADPDHLRMAFDNLIDNASKYTGTDGTIEIFIKRLPKKLVISIRDSGVGIDSRDSDKLFERFSRINNELSDEVGGTGLGLYWAKRVIEMHDGSIEYESKVKKGTTFYVYLPMVTVDA